MKDISQLLKNKFNLRIAIRLLVLLEVVFHSYTLVFQLMDFHLKLVVLVQNLQTTEISAFFQKLFLENSVRLGTYVFVILRQSTLDELLERG